MTGRPDFALSASEFDLLRGDLDLGDAPFPLEVPTMGATMEERAAMTENVYRDLGSRDLVVGGQLDAELEALLRLLFRHDVSVDAVGYLQRPVRALVAANQRAGVLCEIAADQVWLTGIRPTTLANAIVGVLPAVDAGPGRAISVLREPLAKVVNGDDEENVDPFGGDLDDRTALARAGMPTEDADTLVNLANKRQAGGQFGVSHGALRSSAVVTWFDTDQGRYLMVSENSWISLTPADNKRIESRVAHLLSTTV